MSSEAIERRLGIAAELWKLANLLTSATYLGKAAQPAVDAAEEAGGAPVSTDKVQSEPRQD